MKKERSRKRTIFLILSVLFAVIAVVGIVYLISYQVKLQKQQEEYEALQQAMTETQTPAAGEPDETSGDDNAEPVPEITDPADIIEEPDDLSPYQVPEKSIDFDALKAENEDIYAWITIPDTNIDYPVLQHPTELDYYLSHNLDGSGGYPGCIYSQFINEMDFSDFNTVLYGHNMGSGTMFANLHYYEDSEFFDTHPYVYIYTEDGTLVYQVFAAYAFSDVHLLMGFDLSKEEIREIYLNNIFSLEGINDNINRDVEVTTDSKLLTLSTCIRNQAGKRYIVAAVLVADGRERQPENADH